MPMANGNSIYRSTIGTQAKATILLGHKYNGNGTRAQAFTYMTVVDELLYLPLNLLSFFGVDMVWSFVWKRCSGNEVNSMLNAS